MQNKISFQQIDYFLTVAESLNFTDASRLLYISQPALSKQINVMEKELGFPLFVRSRRHVALTPEGASLYRDWSALCRQMEESIRTAKAINSTSCGSLSIGCSDTFDYSDILPHIVREYTKTYPQITVNIESHSFKTLREGLVNDDFDLILTPYFEVNGLSDVHWLRLKEIPLSIVIPTVNPFSGKSSVHLYDLRDETFVLISPKDSLGGTTHTHDLCRRCGFHLKNTHYVPNVSSMELAVKNGLGIAVCNANKFANSDDTCKIFPLDVLQDDSFLVAIWKKRTQNISLSLFVSILREYFPNKPV